MLRFKNLAILSIIGVAFCSCSNDVGPNVGDAVKRSYGIVNDMNKSTVSGLLKVEPTNVQRINNSEIWKYEGNAVNQETKEITYHNLMIKFVDGKVKNIGTFSCKLPATAER